MSTHDIELPPPAGHYYEWDGPYGKRKFSTARHNGRDFNRAVAYYTEDQVVAAIEPYKQRISELEAQLEAVGAGGVSAGQRLMTREAVGLQAPSVALLLKIKTYTAACAERLGQPEIDRRWADICSAARDYAAEQVELDRQRRGEPVAWLYEDELPDNYPYDTMFPYSKVDGVRMFPVYAPQPAEPTSKDSDDFFTNDNPKLRGLNEPVKVPSDDDSLTIAYMSGYHDGKRSMTPEGWQLVPKEPTKEMLAATSWPNCAGTDYKHMLAAAPKFGEEE